MQLTEQLMQHMAWADEQVWSAIGSLEGAQSDARLRELLYHIHMVQWAYLQIWRGDPFDVPTLDSFEGLDALREWGRQFQRELSASPELLAEERLSEFVDFPWAERLTKRFGDVGPATRLESVLQITSHTGHHRGQVHSRIKELGGEPPLVDFIVWVWKRKPRSQ